MTQSSETTHAGRSCICCRRPSSYPSLSKSAIELSRLGIALARGLISGESYDPRQLALSAVRMGAAWANGLSALPTPTDRARWLELSNKLTAYSLFVSAGRLFPTTDADPRDLPAVLEKLSRVDAYSRLWTTEGIGWYYGAAAARRRLTCGRMFALADPVSLPRPALLPLHTGAGLALAQSAFGSPGKGDVRLRLSEFRKQCDEMCSDEYVDVTLEALGLVTITLYPHLAKEIEHELSGSNAINLFWHGVGRGLYFSPLSFVPFSATRRWVVQMSQQAPSSEIGRDNALAGLAWATMLVNVRNPEVLDCCLRDLGEVRAGHDAFGNGVASALIVWQDASPDDPCVNKLQRYCPTLSDASRLWDRAVVLPAGRARRLYNVVRVGKLWGSIFRFQNFEGLLGSERKG